MGRALRYLVLGKRNWQITAAGAILHHHGEQRRKTS
jgi:hypothetical protein